MEYESFSSVSGVLRGAHYNLKESQEHVYGVSFSPDGKFIGACLGAGVVRMLQSDPIDSVQRHKQRPPFDEVPTTMVKFAPKMQDNNKEYMFATVSSGGAVFCWLWDGRSMFDCVFRCPEEKNDTQCVDFSFDNKYLATAGSDHIIRVYDIANKTMSATLSKGVDDHGHARSAHVNRIFSTRFVSATTMVSAGWENPIQVWDLRTGRSERQVLGTQPGCDCLEPLPDGSRFLCSSNRNYDQLQVFDYVNAREIESESKRLCKNIGRRSISSVRYRPETNSLWYVASKPDVIGLMNFSTGEIVCEIPTPVSVLSLDSNSMHPNKVVAGGFTESLLVVERTA